MVKLSIERRGNIVGKVMNQHENSAASPPDLEPVYAEEGLKRMGDFIRRARKRLGLSLRAMAEKTEVSHYEIWALEHGEVKSPQPKILAKIAPYTPYKSWQQLLAIACSDEHTQTPYADKVQVAEDCLEYTDQLSDAEAARLGQLLFARLGRLPKL